MPPASSFIAAAAAAGGGDSAAAAASPAAAVAAAAATAVAVTAVAAAASSSSPSSAAIAAASVPPQALQPPPAAAAVQTTAAATASAAAAAQKKKGGFWLHFIAGGVGGTVGAAATCPLEVVKTRMQSSLYKNLPHSAVQNAKFHPLRAAYAHVSDVVFSLWTIKQREGLRGLWKGLGPNLVGVIPARAIYFSSYHTGKQMYTSLNGHRETPLVHMASAFTAGVATAVATNPIWLIKTRMQLQSERAGQARHYRNSFHCLRAVVKEEGIRGLYKGLSASFLGLSESTLQFVLYEQFKKTLLERKRRDQVMDPAQHLSASTVPKQLDWKDTFAAAASAKLIAAVFAYPHEVLRTRLRESPTTNGVTKYHGLVQSAKLIYIEEGVAGLYGGLTAHLMRVVPNAAIMFATVEFIIHYGSSL